MNAKNSEELKFYLNVPNALTLSRCVLAIPIALLLYRGTESSILLAGILLVIASLTDWLLAALMYLAIISTVLTFYSYLKKGGYVFTD